MKLGDYRVGNIGPRLFEFRFSRFARHYDGEPRFPPLPESCEFYAPDPPPFLLGVLPYEVRERLLAEGMHSAFGVLAEAGVESLQWRQHVLHLEEFLISDDVFEALNGIAPGSFESKAQFRISLGDGRWRTYHLQEPQQYPAPVRGRDNEVNGRPTVIAEECQPPLPPGLRVSAAARLTPTVLAYPLWMAHDDRILALVGNKRVVTEGFVESWRATDISKHLREAHWEHDIEFTPSNGAYGANVRYRWVDVPQD